METVNGSSLYQFLNTSKRWKRGYKNFHKFLNKPLGWFFYATDEIPLRRLNRIECCNLFSEVDEGHGTCSHFISDFCAHVLTHESVGECEFFRCHKNRKCCLATIAPVEKKGFIVFCNVKGSEKSFIEKIYCFIPFLNSEIDSYNKLCDLQSVYENVHPRALALSSLHSVNRAISSSLTMEELIPKVGRLCAQILKAQYCSIMLIDEKRKWLVPKFVLGDTTDEASKRHVMGKGMLGRVAESGDYYISRNCISLPLIDDDVIGVMTVKNRIDKKPFNRSDIEVLKALSEQAVVAIRNSQLLEEHERITLGSIQSINNILDINLPRERTYTHIFARLVYELAKHIGMSKPELLNMQRAASLLDTGHMGIPEEIRRKKGKLTKREFDIIKKHTYHGVDIIKSIDSLKPVIPIILYHHERYDGKGYPEGLAGEEIPLGARIMALVVAFTAMITKRPYREPKSVDEALQEIKDLARTQFDPAVVQHFMELMENEHIRDLLKEH